MNPLIQLENIYFEYPDSQFQLNINTLSFKRSSKTAIVGTSGYGKTTVLNLVAGIISPLRGEVRIDEHRINKLSDRERRNFRIQNIGFIFQDFKLIPYLNLMDNVLLPFRINNSIRLTKDTMDRMHAISEDLGISDKLKKHPAKLSQGEKQRVAICRGLINRPSIILADEPTGNLDPDNKKRIMDILFKAVDQYGATLVTVTHDYDLLKGFDEVVDFKQFHNARS